MQRTDNKKLKNYMESLPAKDKIPMRNRIIDACNVHTITYYNWTAGTCYIPEEKKEIIERIAGVRIFDRDKNSVTVLTH